MPAPLGPTIDSHSPRRHVEVDPVEDAVVAERDRDALAAGSRRHPHAPGGAQHEHEERRAEERGDHTDRDLGRRRRACGPGGRRGTRNAPPNRIDSGSTTRWLRPASRRTVCGTMMPDEADEPGHRHRGRRAERRRDDHDEAAAPRRPAPSVAASSSPTASTSSTRRWASSTTTSPPRRAAAAAPRPTRRWRAGRGSTSTPAGSCPGCAAARRSAWR